MSDPNEENGVLSKAGCHCLSDCKYLFTENKVCLVESSCSSKRWTVWGWWDFCEVGEGGGEGSGGEGGTDLGLGGFEDPEGGGESSLFLSCRAPKYATLEANSGACRTDCECKGERTCSHTGFCTAPAPTHCKVPSWRAHELPVPCLDDCDCNGARQCLKGLCVGDATISATEPEPLKGSVEAGRPYRGPVEFWGDGTSVQRILQQQDTGTQGGGGGAPENSPNGSPPESPPKGGAGGEGTDHVESTLVVVLSLAIGLGVLILLLLIATWCYRRIRRKEQQRKEAEEEREAEFATEIPARTRSTFHSDVDIDAIPDMSHLSLSPSHPSHHHGSPGASGGGRDTSGPSPAAGSGASGLTPPRSSAVAAAAGGGVSGRHLAFKTEPEHMTEIPLTPITILGGGDERGGGGDSRPSAGSRSVKSDGTPHGLSHRSPKRVMQDKV
uniref:Uncharacterized protein n=1 Tax=Chromera velia CCMP2878 TaxID=1169474 RepID=A0A0G4HEV8_9ALVE|eukprot:Cvel_6602.t1-p1 / transcript=Cvel_6602.t1 / gene=Cvel_6602 / organism=Chromera_velia_CCMP2878 / gene_product=hypothetical protein / transcript_product=hypothetical protein / location=Cvel_scaffold326:76327-79481(+) / protein_length=440 / sequence_SO=supercontig / SO=protein_coding / is_pseudo=false